MEKKHGKIEGVGVKEGSSEKGPWKRWTFEIEGKKYSTFDNRIGEKFQVGDQVVIEGEQEGKYWNMKTMDYWDGKETTTPTQPAPNQTEKPETMLKQIYVELCTIRTILEDGKKRKD